jgi:transcriptional regulator with PAS, ATPase and Fis domain
MDALPALIAHFLKRHNEHFGKSLKGLDEHAASLLAHYDFPGNVRELESIIAHAVIMADGSLITAQDLPDQVRHGRQPRLALPFNAEDGILTLAEMEAKHIAETLERLDGNQTNTADKLGISRSTLWRKMREYGIAKAQDSPTATPR